MPLLLISLFIARKNSLPGLFLLSGTLGYFLVMYLFYLAMGMFNKMFLVYAFLLSTTFFGFILTALSIKVESIEKLFMSGKLARNGRFFLIINGSLVALLWFGVVVPLLSGTVFPPELQHYTTLIVQGFDLGLLLPIAFVVGYLALKKNFYGYLLTPIYMIFLSLLMTALVAKI